MKILILGDFFVDSDERLDSIALRRYDLVVVNLEAPLVDDGDVHPSIKLGPSLKMSTSIASRLSELGVTHCTLANNHIMDYGVLGLKSTVAALEKQSAQSRTSAIMIFQANRNIHNVATDMLIGILCGS